MFGARKSHQIRFSARFFLDFTLFGLGIMTVRITGQSAVIFRANGNISTCLEAQAYTNRQRSELDSGRSPVASGWLIGARPAHPIR